MSDYERRFEAAKAELDRAGIWSSNGIPPLVHAGRRLGLSPRPPHFTPFWKNFVEMFVFFSLVYGLIMYVLIWRADGLPLSEVAQSTSVAGAIFAVLMSLSYWHGRRKYGFSRWEDL